MTIPVLAQVYAEARRLAVAGSVVARGDFRLKKLLPPLEAAGKQAPVFAKIAESARAVVDGPEASSAAALLELASLVSAVMYTQGETGLAGELKPVETTDLGGSVAQTSARTLKPLLEALTSTGSGRLELVKDAHARGLFRDLRLVKPALAAIDDPYPDVADLIAGEVLPRYGKAILPELRAAYDPKGTKGHPRRLALMHAIDPAGTRELVLAALDGGSKEVRVAAVACLGSEPGDLAVLVEQASAKAQDVREAAYRALANVDKQEAVAVLAKAVAGKDYQSAANAIGRGTNPKLADTLAAEARATIAGLANEKDKKKVGESIKRANWLLRSFPNGSGPAADALLLDLFTRRNELAKIKGDSHSGADLNEVVVRALAKGSKATRQALVAARADLPPAEIAHALAAGRGYLTPAELYDAFAPYLTAGILGKKDANAARREAISGALGGGNHRYWWYRRRDGDEATLDPNWLHAAVQIKDIGLIAAIGRPGDTAANALLTAEYDRLKGAKSPDELTTVVAAMIQVRHPQAAETLAESYLKATARANGNTYWYAHFVRKLPKSAIPVLEAIIPRLKEKDVDRWADAIQDLREQPD